MAATPMERHSSGLRSAPVGRSSGAGRRTSTTSIERSRRTSEMTTKIGKYDVEREIGRGGMAVVYLARDVDLERWVALKEPAGVHVRDAAFIARFVREARLAASLNHPNIVTVYGYFDDGGVPYIEMEYLQRGSLRPLVGSL